MKWFINSEPGFSKLGLVHNRPIANNGSFKEGNIRLFHQILVQTKLNEHT